MSGYPILAAIFLLLGPPASFAADGVEHENCWAVELGVYARLENAERRLAGLADNQCRISSDESRHRVLCGCYESADAARQSIRHWRAIDIEQDTFARLPGLDKARVLRRRPYERPPKTDFSTELWGRRLTLGGEISLEQEARRDYAFASEADDLDRLSLGLELQAFYHYSDQSAIYIEIEGNRQTDVEPESDDEDTESQWTRGEMWLFSSDWSGGRMGYQLGRQNFADERGWWWDKNLDAVRLRYDSERLHFEAALAQELARESTDEENIDPRQEDVLRLISNATWAGGENHEISLFALLQEDGSQTGTAGDIVDREQRDESDLDAIWLGARAQGRFGLGGAGRLYYWLDAGLVAGEEKIVDYDSVDPARSRVDAVDEAELRGVGFDLGTMWRTKLPGELTFSLAYAVGSGDDDPDDEIDEAYRQTGLNRNDDRFRGVNGFRYYGDLLRPELSNIAITTLAIGFRFLPDSSVELVYHTYRQREPSDEIRDARLDIDPTGDDDDIGNEIDLIVGIEESDNFTVELVLSRFEAGDAFDDYSGETAYKGSLELEFHF